MTRPAVGSSRRRIKRPSVDFPEPDSPTRPSVSPAGISRSTPPTALTVSRFPRRPSLPAGNSLLTPTHCTRFSAVDDAAVSDGEGCAERLASDSDAGGIVVRGLALERWIDGGAVRDRDRASRMKAASAGRRGGVRNRTCDGGKAVRLTPVDPRNRGEQAARVRVERIGEELRSGGPLHHARRI